MIEFAPTPNLTNEQSAALVEGRNSYNEWEDLLRGMNPIQMVTMGERAKKDIQGASTGSIQFWMALASALNNAASLALNANDEARNVCRQFAVNFKNIAVGLAGANQDTIDLINSGWAEQDRGLAEFLQGGDPHDLFRSGKINQWGIVLG